MAITRMSSLLATVIALGLNCHFAAAALGDRSLLSGKQVEADEARSLYIDPNARPQSTLGFNVIVSIICDGKFTTVNTIKLRGAIQTLGFPTDAQNFQFGGNAATTNWRSITTFVINIPNAASGDVAIKTVKAKVTVKALNQLAKLPKANPVKQVIFTAFQA